MAHAWRKDVLLPKQGPELAEFIGIMMGDEGISRYQIAISLHRIDDSLYSTYVQNLAESLFGIRPSRYINNKDYVCDLVISRITLVYFLHKLGLPIGDKVRAGLRIPYWIRSNPEFLRSCIRGLIDTDGSIFTHRYASKGKLYMYKKLSFTSASPPLLSDVYKTLRSYGMHARIGSNKDVRIDSRSDMEKYFSLVGTNNPKHLRRYRS